MNIRLSEMTIPLMRQFFREFTYDPDTFENPADCIAYFYSEESADAFYKKNQKPDRKHFAILADDGVVGDLYLKRIDLTERSCTLSIHMKNDSAKNKGYGTKAERLALKYTFEELQLESVNAEALIRNTRSRHVLEKVGFKEVRRDAKYSYYECRIGDWQAQAGQ